MSVTALNSVSGLNVNGFAPVKKSEIPEGINGGIFKKPEIPEGFNGGIFKKTEIPPFSDGGIVAPSTGEIPPFSDGGIIAPPKLPEGHVCWMA